MQNHGTFVFHCFYDSNNISLHAACACGQRINNWIFFYDGQDQKCLKIYVKLGIPISMKLYLKQNGHPRNYSKLNHFNSLKKKTLINLSWNQAIAIVLVIEILSMHLLLFRLNSSILSIWNGGTSWITFESERIYIWITNVYKILYYKLTLLN